MDEEQLVRGLRSQDPGAVQELVVSHGDRLLRSACLLCGDQVEAQDLVQETLLHAIRSAPRFRGCSKVYTWLHGIMLNLTRHYHRDPKRMVYDEELARQEPAPPEENPNRLDVELTSGALTEARARLPPSKRAPAHSVW